MPVRVRGNRLVEPSGRIARNRASTPLDGGGERSHAVAVRHARAINLSELRRRGRRGIQPAPRRRRRTTTARRRVGRRRTTRRRAQRR